MSKCTICGETTTGHMVGQGLGVWVETCPRCGDLRSNEVMNDEDFLCVGCYNDPCKCLPNDYPCDMDLD